jgi:putative spermidine/putrescine transport system permease protein
VRSPASVTGVTHGARIWLYALCAVIVIYLALPALIVIPMSFSDSSFLEFPPRQLSLRWYRAFAESPEWRAAAWMSLKVAGLTVLLATPLGTAAAYALRLSHTRWTPFLAGILSLPMLVPHILIAIGLFFLFSRIGLTNTLPGLALGHTVIALPFVVVVVLAALQDFDLTQERAARVLGASRPVAFFRVVLPQIRFPVFAGALFAFIASFDEAILSLLLTTGHNSTLTRRMFLSLRDAIDPTIAAISTILILMAVLLAVVALVLNLRRKDPRNA